MHLLPTGSCPSREEGLRGIPTRCGMSHLHGLEGQWRLWFCYCYESMAFWWCPQGVLGLCRKWRWLQWWRQHSPHHLWHPWWVEHSMQCFPCTAFLNAFFEDYEKKKKKNSISQIRKVRLSNLFKNVQQRETRQAVQLQKPGLNQQAKLLHLRAIVWE